MINKSFTLYHIERKKYFKKLHRELVKKYKTQDNHISYKKIHAIRILAISRGMTKKGALKWLDKKLEMNKNHRKHNLMWYIYINNFLEKCTKDEWNDITQITEYDNNQTRVGEADVSEYKKD